MFNKARLLISLIIGLLCRYIFFSVYGFISILAIDIGFINFLMDLFPCSVYLFVFRVQDIVTLVISAFISAILPSVIFGYRYSEYKKDFKLYSLMSYLGIVIFDLIYYAMIFNDL